MQKFWKDCDAERVLLNAKVIQTLLGSFVEVIGGNAFLIHLTLRDFLRGSGILEQAGILKECERAEVLLADACQTYLSLDEYMENRSKSFELATKRARRFLSYAAKSWF